MEIVKLPNKIIRQKSIDVPFPLSSNSKKIAKTLITYLAKTNDPKNNLKPGIGVAAVQLGYLLRMFYVNFIISEFDTMEELLINPIILNKSEKWGALKNGEGCLSVDADYEKEGLVHRHYAITVQGFSYFKMKKVILKLKGFAAIVFQHELDHLDGTLFIDRIDFFKPDKIKKNELII